MDKLQTEVIRQIYEYDSTYKNKFDKVLKQMMAHCFIYNCRICFKPCNNCCCYCPVCKTYLKLCQQIYYDERSTYEDDFKMITALSGDLKLAYLFLFVCRHFGSMAIPKGVIAMMQKRKLGHVAKHVPKIIQQKHIQQQQVEMIETKKVVEVKMKKEKKEKKEKKDQELQERIHNPEKRLNKTNNNMNNNNMNNMSNNNNMNNMNNNN